MTSVTYPSVYNHSGTFTTSFDTMSRPSSMTDGVGVFTISNVSYGPANELLSIGYSQCAGCSPYIEGRTYNSRLQLTSIGSLQYIYPAGPNNNGKASEQKVTGGEDVVYAYDALNRLISAQTTGSSTTNWGQNFVYDGFGNLYQKNPINAPALSVGVNSATNQLSVSGVGYDANGNTLGPYPMSQTYDVENRVSSAGQYNIPQVLYAYDGGNRRVWKGTYNSSGVMQTQEAYFYAPNGQKLGTYALVLTNPPGYSNYATATDLNVFFGGKRVGHGVNNAGTVVLTATSQDRVGSYGSYYPYGEDKGTPLANDQMKFATYTRDSETGLDYAINRYYSSGWGRFASPDPYMSSGGPLEPQSWNRYAYVKNDPVSFTDRMGLFTDCDDGGNPPCFLGTPPYGGGGGSTSDQMAALLALLDSVGIVGGGGVFTDALHIDGLSLPIWAVGGYQNSLAPVAAGGAVLIESPVGAGVVTIGITIWGIYQLYEWVAKNPAVPAPWPGKEAIDKELKSWKYNQVDDKFEQDCPPGSLKAIRTMHWNPPDRFHAFGHYDYVDCDGNSWSVWLDGTMTPRK